MKSFIGCEDCRKERNPRERLKRVGLLRTRERSGVAEYGGLWVSIGLRLKRRFGYRCQCPHWAMVRYLF